MRKLSFALLGLLTVMALNSCGPAKPIDVTVSVKEFSIDSSETLFKVGQPYVFHITNNGTVNHEFVIQHPWPPEELISGHDMSDAIVNMMQDELIPGKTVDVEVTFTEAADFGALEMACHVKGHYEGGMTLPITVEK
jgi:uncharacterized cupredoxin-like copper-binding protein